MSGDHIYSALSEEHGGDTRWAFGTGFTDAHDLEIHPGLWAGVGLVRGGAGTALVGSHEEVAASIAESAISAGVR